MRAKLLELIKTEREITMKIMKFIKMKLAVTVIVIWLVSLGITFALASGENIKIAKENAFIVTFFAPAFAAYEITNEITKKIEGKCL